MDSLLEIQVRNMIALTVRRSNESRLMLAAVWDEVNDLLVAALHNAGSHTPRRARAEAIAALLNGNDAAMEGACK